MEIIDKVSANNLQAIEFLEKTVNINSGTLNIEGVNEAGHVFGTEFGKIGFEVQYRRLPDAIERGSHVMCRLTTGTPKGKKLLLIGHLDTVFESDNPFQKFSREGDMVYGPGVQDMKGGNTVILYALKALKQANVLNDTQIIVVLTSDEENVGIPVNVSREVLIEAAKESDVALGFESASGMNYATVARRSAGSWLLETFGKSAHSSGVFSNRVGAGAIYEMARILNTFNSELHEPNLTFNAATVVGGDSVYYDPSKFRGNVSGKTNIVPRKSMVSGDIRCLTQAQLDTTVSKMKAIVSNHLPNTSARITFDLRYPPMAPKSGNYEILQILDGVSRDMGLGNVQAYDPAKRGAGDISFVAKYLDCLDGLGAIGSGSHTSNESLDLTYFDILTQRAALLIYRLIGAHE